MLGPITSQLAAQAARKAAVESARKRVRDADQTTGPGRDGDSFDSELHAIEAADGVRRLADADQEDAQEDRQASQRRPDHTPIKPDGEGGQLDLNA